MNKSQAMYFYSYSFISHGMKNELLLYFPC